jgi:subtilisin family serine protease
MSLGGSKSAAVNSAAANAVSAGVFFAVAAGNDGKDAANSSPASEATVFTVGATDSADKVASFSNYGSVVDIHAPGVSILSTWLNGGTNTISGTSMATPHVAGLAAYILALEGKKTPAALSTRLQALAVKDKITGLKGSTKNYIAFNGNPSG